MIGPTDATPWQWQDPAWFALLLVLPVLWAWRRRARTGARLAAAALLRRSTADGPPLPASPRAALAWLPAGFEALALVAATAALARPVQSVPLPPERKGCDVLLCLDRSSSMAATDLAPGRTRLDVAKAAAAEFVGRRPGDRIGVVEFARHADLRCPPTLDHGALGELLAGLRMVEKDGPEDATGIGAAVAAAAAVLQRSTGKSKVIVLLTDGEENVATTAAAGEIAPLHAAQLCAGLGIRVHTIVVGLGDPQPDGSRAPLDTTAVRQIAATTGGRFFAARDAAALQAIGAAIDALEATPFAEPRSRRREGFLVPLAAAIALLGLAHLLARTRLEVLP